jgi:hypothetical protein
MRMWTEQNLPRDLIRPEALERLRVPAERSDILRLELLHRFGGVYVDTDFECRQSLEPYIQNLDFFVAQLKPNRVNNAFIGATAGHPILMRALHELRPREFHGYDKWATGPLFLDRLLSDYPGIHVFPPGLLYPRTPAEEDAAIAIHHAARSWKDADGFRKATLVAERRLRETQRRLLELERAHKKTAAKLESLRRRRSVRRPLRDRASLLTARLRRRARDEPVPHGDQPGQDMPQI